MTLLKLYKGLSFAICFFALIFSNDVLAQSEQSSSAANAPEILITPSRFKKKLRQNSRTVQVIDAEQIRRTNSRNVLDVIRQAVGVDIVQSGGLGRSSSVFIRGAESDHTLVLVDGVRVNDPNVGNFDLADLQVDAVEKIEIIRGASSAAYGSEAIGGVINIITKEPTSDLAGSVRAQGGSYGTHSEQLDLVGGVKGFANGLSLSYLGSDGISAANASRGNSENDPYKNISLSTRSKFEFSEKTKLSFNLRALKAKTDFDGFDFTVGAIDDLNFYQDRELTTSGLVIESELIKDLNLKSEVSYSNEQIQGKDGNDEFNNYKIRGENRFASIALSNQFNQDNLTSVGFDYLNRRAVNKSNFADFRDTLAIWAEHTLTLYEDITMNFGVRTEHSNDFGSVFVYDVSPIYRYDKLGSNLHSSLGTGFKAPSFNELYYPNFGNPNLDRERSRSYDLGVKQYLSRNLSADITLFYNDFKDLITFDTSTFIAQNIAAARARGVESTFDYKISELSGVSLNYVFTDTEDKSTGQALARRARNKAGIQFYISPIEKLQVAASLSLVGRRFETSGQRMDNYQLADLNFSYLITEKRKLFLKLNNLFDKDYEELPGYGVAGFSAFAGVELGLF